MQRRNVPPPPPKYVPPPPPAPPPTQRKGKEEPLPPKPLVCCGCKHEMPYVELGKWSEMNAYRFMPLNSQKKVFYCR